jgi:hypothetical protein
VGWGWLLEKLRVRSLTNTSDYSVNAIVRHRFTNAEFAIGEVKLNRRGRLNEIENSVA